MCRDSGNRRPGRNTLPETVSCGNILGVFFLRYGRQSLECAARRLCYTGERQRLRAEERKRPDVLMREPPLSLHP